MGFRYWVLEREESDQGLQMARIANSGSLEDGLVFLWAMEQVSDIRTVQKQPELTLIQGISRCLEICRVPATQKQHLRNWSAVSTFASNWTSPEFYRFVDDLATTVNGFNIPPDSVGWKRAKEIWLRIIELEEAFWPTDGEEKSMKKSFVRPNWWPCQICDERLGQIADWKWWRGLLRARGKREKMHVMRRGLNSFSLTPGKAK